MEDKHHSLLGIFFIVLGAFSFSVMFLFVKFMKGTNTFTLVFYRAVCEISIAIAELRRNRESLLGPPEVRLHLVIRAAAGAIAVCAFFYGIQMLPLPDAVTLQFITPAFSAAFAVCLVGEPWKLLDIVGSVVCLMGVAFIARPTWLFGPGNGSEESTISDDGSLENKSMAILVTLGGAATAGLAYVMVRKIGDRASAVHMVLYFGVLSIPITLIGSSYLVGEWRIWGKEMFSFTEVCLLLAIGLSSYAGQFFTNLGLQHETAATVSYYTFEAGRCCERILTSLLQIEKIRPLWRLQHRLYGEQIQRNSFLQIRFTLIAGFNRLVICHIGPTSSSYCFCTKRSTHGAWRALDSFWGTCLYLYC